LESNTNTHNSKPKLLVEIKNKMRVIRYSPKTIEAYTHVVSFGAGINSPLEG
jgi:hypothetical protein